MSKDTEERQLPGTFEGETVTRRRFIAGTARAARALAATAITLPVLGFSIAPVFDRASVLWHPKLVGRWHTFAGTMGPSTVP